jgi:hypothetical protein
VPVKKEDRAANKPKNYLQPPVDIKISGFHLSLKSTLITIISELPAVLTGGPHT